jgi:hypothetical protein
MEMEQAALQRVAVEIFKREASRESFMSRLLRDATYGTHSNQKVTQSSTTIAAREAISFMRLSITPGDHYRRIEESTRNVAVIILKGIIEHVAAIFMRQSRMHERFAFSLDRRDILAAVRYHQCRTGWDDWAVLVPRQFWTEIDYTMAVCGIELVPVPTYITGESLYIAPKEFIKLSFIGRDPITVSSDFDLVTRDTIISAESWFTLETNQKRRGRPKPCFYTVPASECVDIPWLALSPGAPPLPDIEGYLHGLGLETTRKLLETAEAFQ